MSKLFNFTKSLKKFHQEERGLEALQVVMIIAVAAIVMLLVKNNYETVRDWMEKLVDDICSFTEEGGLGAR